MEHADAVPVAVLGAGRMGTAITERLASHGYHVKVWNRTLERARSLEGGTVVAAASSAEAVAGCGVVISILGDDAAVTEVVTTLELENDAVLVEASTIGPRTMADLAATTTRPMLGCAVSGNPAVVRGGHAGVLLAGPDQAKLVAGPVLRSFAANLVDLGSDPTSAKLAKLGLNALLAGTCELLAEIILVMEAAGLERDSFAGALDTSVLASPFIRYKMDAAVRRDYEATFTTRGLAKDLDLTLSEASRNNVALPLLLHTRELVEDAIAHNLGEKDFLSLLPRLQVANGLPSDVPVPTTMR
ncbi:NAD(P)-dependent oxidoreductase [Streptomyces sp. NPDC050743]|uniref:NAD(P)-dependent oxidoreductase n=1 Tax=Streptomyces sp. NPDC050743 TaxID=3365634 RepID=UPI0037B7F1AE